MRFKTSSTKQGSKTFVRTYKHAHETLLSEEEEHPVWNHIKEDAPIRLSPQKRLELIVGEDRCIQNLPTVNKIATIIPNQYSDSNFKNILAAYQTSYSASDNSLFKQINDTHTAFMRYWSAANHD